jgi:hypothetical protein
MRHMTRRVSGCASARDASRLPSRKPPWRPVARPRGFALAVIVLVALRDHDPQRACTAARDLLSIASSGDSQRLAPQVAAILRALLPYRRLPEAQDIFDIARAAGLMR